MTEKSLAINQALGVERLGEIMWKSGYWQDTRSQAQAIVKILAGAELEFGPIASMNGIYIIDGKTSLSAGLVGAAIQRSGRYRYRVVEHDAKHCIIDFFEILSGKREPIGTSSFDMTDAQAAGLLGKRGGNWEKYSRNMLFSRALTNGARWYCPDVFNGPVYTPDELGAELDIEGNVVETVDVEVREVEQPAAPPQARMVISTDERIWQRWEEVRSEALQYGVKGVPSVVLPIAYTQLVSTAGGVLNQIKARKDQLAAEDAARAVGRVEHEATPPEEGDADAPPRATQDAPPGPTPLADAWARNRGLMAQLYAAGLRIKDLPRDVAAEELFERNAELERLLAKKSEA